MVQAWPGGLPTSSILLRKRLSGNTLILRGPPGRITGLGGNLRLEFRRGIWGHRHIDSLTTWFWWAPVPEPHPQLGLHPDCDHEASDHLVSFLRRWATGWPSNPGNRINLRVLNITVIMGQNRGFAICWDLGRDGVLV